MMKIRVRWVKKTVLVSLDDSDHPPTLLELKEAVAREFEVGEFSLSLNKNDPLPDDDNTPLSELGIISGDLLFLLSEEQPPKIPKAAPVAADQPRPDAQGQAVKKDTDMDTTETNATAASAMPGTSSASSASATAAAAEAEPVEFDPDSMDNDEAIKDAEVNRYLNEPVLVQDCVEGAVTVSLQRAYEESRPQNIHEAVCVALHVLMTESRFQAQPPSDTPHQLPGNWRSAGSYRLSYTHSSCPDWTFQLVCVPMGSLLVLHGSAQMTGDEECNSRYQLQMRPSDYVKAISQDAAATYRSLGRLARLFKDHISYPLLQSALPDDQTVPSLVNLAYEVKLVVLKYLDVRSLLRLSRVNQHLNAVCKERVLWRRLYLKDFGRRTNSELAQDWKQFYREKYLLRKRMREDFYRRMTVVVPPYVDHPHPPFPMAPVYPGILGGDYDLNPDFQGIPGPFGPLGHVGLRGRGPIFPRPRFDPIGPMPGQRFPPGRGRGIWDGGANRRGFGGGGFGPRFF